MEGAESHTSGADFARLYQSGGSGAGGAGAPRVPPGLNSFTITAGNPLVTPSLGVENTWVVGFGIKNSAATETIWTFKLAANEQCHLQRVFDTGNLFKLALYRGATLIATTSVSFDSTLWNYFEFKVVVRTGTNGSYELRHNEVNIASLTAGSVNLADTGGDGCDVHGFGSAGLTDDVYILDSTGTNNTDFLGDSAIYQVLPDGDGDVIDWTPSTGVTHFDLVDAIDADNVQSDTNAEKDLYNYAALPTTGLGAIFAVAVLSTASMNAVGSRTLKPKYRNLADAEGDGANFAVISTVLADFPIIIEDNPITSLAWTKSDIDDGQFGVEVVS